MIMDAILIVVGASLVWLTGEVARIMFRNYKAHQLFKRNLPSLPVLPNVNIFSGNMVQFSDSYEYLHERYRETGHKMFGGFYCEKPVIATMDIDLIKRVVLDDPDANVNRFEVTMGMRELELDNVMTAEGDQWRRIRKAVAPAFSRAKVKKPNVQEEITSVIDKYLFSIEEKLNRAATETSRATVIEDIEDSTARYTHDLVFTCFYKQINLIDYNCDVNFWVDRAVKGGHDFAHPITKISAMFPFSRPLIRWLVSNFNDMGQMVREFAGFIKQQTNLHLRAHKELVELQSKRAKEGILPNLDNFELKDGSNFKRNMMDYVIEEFRLGKLTATEYENTSLFIFFAGMKTSADAISKLIWHLALHPEIQEKLRDSITREGPNSKYLDWCISESMRLYPPALVGCSRTLSQSVESDFGTIPAGVFVLTSTYSIHRCREYWGADADEFKPERWANADQFHPCQYIPFGLGRRACPGKEFALQEMRMLMDKMLRKFKFERSSKTIERISFKAPLFLFNMADEPVYISISLLK